MTVMTDSSSFHHSSHSSSGTSNVVAETFGTKMTVGLMTHSSSFHHSSHSSSGTSNIDQHNALTPASLKVEKQCHNNTIITCIESRCTDNSLHWPDRIDNKELREKTA